ncbi:hypothetical protein ACXZ65_34475 [Streptomyces aculeolatus]
MTTTTTSAAALRVLADTAVTHRRDVRYLHPDIAPKINPDPANDGAYLVEFVNGLDAVDTERALNAAGWTVEPGPRKWGAVVLRTRAPKESR